MKLFNLSLVSIVVILAVSGCSTNVKQSLGIQKDVPDERVVMKHPPLTMPPNYDLRPPLEQPMVNDASSQVISKSSSEQFSKGELALKAKIDQSKDAKKTDKPAKNNILSKMQRIFSKEKNTYARDAVADDNLVKTNANKPSKETPSQEKKICDIKNGTVKYCSDKPLFSKTISVDMPPAKR